MACWASIERCSLAFSAAMIWDVRNGGSDANGGGFRGGANLTTPSAPSVATATSGGTVAANTYYVVVTLTDGNGETPKSVQTSQVTTGATSTITVTSPTNPNSQGATWSVYVGTASGGPYFSQGAGLTIGANRVITTTPPTSGTQAPGVDYSQQNGAQVGTATLTDMVIDGTTNTLFTSVVLGTNTAYVGNIINVTAGVGFTVQRVEITGMTAAGVYTADKSLGTLSSTGGTGNLGGALATLGTAGGLHVADNRIFLKYHATAYPVSASPNTAGGGIQFNSGGSGRMNALVGYDTTRDINNSDANRPSLDPSANSVVAVRTATYTLIRNINIINSVARTGLVGIKVNAISSFAQCCKVTGGTAQGFLLSGGGAEVMDCQAHSCAVGFEFQAAGVATGCVSTSATAIGFKNNQVSGWATARRCLSISSTTAGFSNVIASGSFFLEDCVGYGSGQDNFIALGGGVFRNCVGYAAGTDAAAAGLPPCSCS